MSRIAVVGGHGKIALHLARILTERGHQVSSIIRNPAQCADVETTGADAVVADVETIETDELAALFIGHDAIVWSAGAGGGNPERTYAVDRDAAINAMTAAERAGARRFVMVSYFGSSPTHGVPADSGFFAYAEAKAAADEHLRATGLDWTILGPSTLTTAQATGQIDVDAAEAGTVAREDVALAVAGALENPATIGRTIAFNSGNTPIQEALAG